MVEQRLERLLAERAPRRARPDHSEGAEGDEAGLDEVAADADGGEDLEEELAARPARRRGDRAVGRISRRLVDPDEPVVAGVGARWPGFTRAHLAVVGVLVLLGLLLGGWAVLRAKPVPLPAAAVAGPRSDQSSAASPFRSPASPAASARASPVATPGGQLVVHVLGAVRRPGLVELPAGARVQDAIEAAGGLRAGARLGDLNLAQPLVDGQQLVVGKSAGGRSEVRGGTAAPGGVGPNGSTSTPGTTGSPLDLNTATTSQLETLPGVGPVTAAKIIAWREEHGRFSRVEELQEVSGIGPKTYAEIAPHCRV